MYRAKQTFETFHQFEQAFGDQRHRLVKVIGGTTAHALAKTHIWAIDSLVLNPHQVKPDAYSLAPYFGNGLNGKDTDIVARSTEPVAPAPAHGVRIQPTRFQVEESGQLRAAGASDSSQRCLTWRRSKSSPFGLWMPFAWRDVRGLPKTMDELLSFI